jgi:hypothetical protein
MVHLSGASSLVNLAKSISSPDRQSRILDIAGRIRGGSYASNAQQTSRAIITSLAA